MITNTLQAPWSHLYFCSLLRSLLDQPTLIPLKRSIGFQPVPLREAPEPFHALFLTTGTGCPPKLEARATLRKDLHGTTSMSNFSRGDVADLGSAAQTPITNRRYASSVARAKFV